MLLQFPGDRRYPLYRDPAVLARHILETRARARARVDSCKDAPDPPVDPINYVLAARE